MTDKRSRETAKISGWVLTALLTAFSAPLFAQEYPNRRGLAEQSGQTWVPKQARMATR